MSIKPEAGHPQEILLAEPRGFCAGVDRAIEIVERAIIKFGAPIYVRHEIVHNTYVVNDLKDKGAIFIEELSDVPPGATLVFSAHGVSLAVQEEARQRGFQIFDATCPLVSKVHVEVAKLHKEGYEFIMIGHKGHPEVEGTMGQLDSGIHLVEDVADVARIQPGQTALLAVVTQTTLSVDDAAEISAAVKARFPQVREPKQQDICYATQNRQDAVKVMSPQVDVLIVVGSPTSSNSNRLRELAAKLGTSQMPQQPLVVLLWLRCVPRWRLRCLRPLSASSLPNWAPKPTWWTMPLSCRKAGLKVATASA